MQDTIQKSRSPFQKIWSIILLFFAAIYIFTIYHLECCPFKNIPSELLLFVVKIASGPCILIFALYFHLFMIYLEAEEAHLRMLLWRIGGYFNKMILLFVASLVILLCVIKNEELYYSYSGITSGFPNFHTFCMCLILFMVTAISFVCLYNVCYDYDDVDLLLSQNSKKSIGASWAIGAYYSYYESTLKDMIGKIRAFEVENGIEIPLKKLVIICPLSCKVEGSLNTRADGIFHKGQLRILELDQGANVNRRYKHSVYGINRSQSQITYVVAEFGSPLGTLWLLRSSMNKEKWKYHRDCFIENLKDVLQYDPCVILVYDDENPSQQIPLDRFLLSSIDQLLQERNLMM